MSRFNSIPGLAKVELGETVESPSINRVDVADGTRGRVIPLTKEWMAATIAFTDEPLRGSWFVDRSILLKYGLRGRLVYICPVIRLNTDARAKVLDANYKIEYLRLSENVYNEFAASASEMSNMHSITVTKTKKGEFSFVQPAPSNKQLSDAEIKLINQVIQQCQAYDVEAVTYMALTDCARPFSDYLELARSKNIEVGPPAENISGELPSSITGNSALAAPYPANCPQINQIPSNQTIGPAPLSAFPSDVEDASFSDADEFGDE